MYTQHTQRLQTVHYLCIWCVRFFFSSYLSVCIFTFVAWKHIFHFAISLPPQSAWHVHKVRTAKRRIKKKSLISISIVFYILYKQIHVSHLRVFFSSPPILLFTFFSSALSLPLLLTHSIKIHEKKKLRKNKINAYRLECVFPYIFHHIHRSLRTIVRTRTVPTFVSLRRSKA